MSSKPRTRAPMPTLVRGMGPAGATAVNVLAMVGIGPLITIPLVLAALPGPLSLAGWIGGALLALCDGLVYAELGSLYPGSGGTYGYLRSVFGAPGWGALLAFMFAWQTVFAAPLNLAVAYIGLANYTGYLVPHVLAAPLALHGAAAAFALIALVAVLRGITAVSRAGIALAALFALTMCIVAAAGYVHFSPRLAFALPVHDSLWRGLGLGFGQALLLATFDYGGYNAAPALGDEIQRPQRSLPLAIVGSVVIVAALYLTLQIGVLGALPAADLLPRADGSLPPLGQHLASALVERAFGGPLATAITIAIVAGALGSAAANLLSYARIPYAAARDGGFLRVFAHVHPRLRIPDVALAAIGLLAIPACFFSLDAVINALTTGMLLVQSFAQIVALGVLRRRGIRAPYRMWLYPLPALVAAVAWAYVFVSAGTAAMTFGAVTVAAGGAVFLVLAARARTWPFARARAEIA